MKKNRLSRSIVIALLVLISLNPLKAQVADYVSALKDSLSSLSERAGDEILSRHFNSLLQVINSKAALTRSDTNRLEALYDSLFLDNSACSLLELSSYTSGCRSMIISWVSVIDDEVSFTQLKLPTGFSADSTYPLYVDLHGLWDVAGDKMQYLVYPYRVEFNPDSERAFEDGIHSSPWGRGNLWYRGISEDDIWECIRELNELFKIDSTRRYLTGHSMGGYGSWYIASRSAEFWAGVGVYAGSLWMQDAYIPQRLFSLRDKPVYFVVGDQDSNIDHMSLAYSTLQAIGNNNLEFVTFSGGHEFRREDVIGFYQWIRGFSTQIHDNGDYLGQDIPADSAEVFAPDLVSTAGQNEYAPRFNTQFSEFFYTVEQNHRENLISYGAIKEGGTWTDPDTAFFSKLYPNSGEAFLQNDSTLFFTRNIGEGGNPETEFWKASKNAEGVWNEAESLGSPVNDIGQSYHLSVSASGNIIFSSNGEGYLAPYAEGVYQTPYILEHPERLDDHNEDVFIDPHENYILYTVDNGDNKDLYIVYNNYGIFYADFTYPKSLGSVLNTQGDEFSPYVSPDGRYLFFSRDEGNGADIYWVNADIIDSLRNTNFTPYLIGSLQDQHVTQGQNCRIDIPNNVFYDDNGSYTLHATAAQINGDPLPEGLVMSGSMIRGTPLVSGVFEIEVTVYDEEELEISDTFVLTIEEASDIEASFTEKLRVYPNPTSDILYLSGIEGLKIESYELIAMHGVSIRNGFIDGQSIDLSGTNPGLYILRINTDKGLYLQKIMIR